jgi:putative ABC transport system permease protein
VRGFVWSQFRFRRNRILVLGLAILVAAVSFVLLTSTAKSSSLHIQGTLKTNFRPAYDILVRPRGSKTPLERQQGLVPPNYLSGIFGGITLRQWRQILGMRGVAVAAPIANIGYILPLGYPQVPLRPYVRSAERQILRVRGTWLAYNRRVGYSGRTTAYVYVTRRAAKSDRFTIGLIERLPRGKKATPCSIAQRTFGTEGDALKSPFAQGKYMTCYSTRSPDADGPVSVNGWRQERTIGVAYDSYFPLLLAAIDPVEEARSSSQGVLISTSRYVSRSTASNSRRPTAPCARSPAPRQRSSSRLVVLAESGQRLSRRRRFTNRTSMTGCRRRSCLSVVAPLLMGIGMSAV